MSLGGRAKRCPECGAAAPERVLSAQAGQLHLVRSPRETRKQERENAELREGAKTRFAEARRRTREQKARAPGKGGTKGGDG